MPESTVVVGAAQGIGADIARHLATLEWTGRIILADRHLALAEQVAAEIRAGGHEAEALAVDISEPASIRRLAAYHLVPRVCRLDSRPLDHRIE